MFFVNGMIADAKAARFDAERTKAEGLVEAASGILWNGNGEKYLIEAGDGLGGGNGANHERASEALLPGGGHYKDAPDVSFVAALGGRFLIEADGADECILVKCAKDEVFGAGWAEAVGISFDGNLAKFLGGFDKRKRIGLKREHAELPEELSVVFGEAANFHGATDAFL